MTACPLHEPLQEPPQESKISKKKREKVLTNQKHRPERELGQHTQGMAGNANGVLALLRHTTIGAGGCHVILMLAQRIDKDGVDTRRGADALYWMWLLFPGQALSLLILQQFGLVGAMCLFASLFLAGLAGLLYIAPTAPARHTWARFLPHPFCCRC